VGKKLKTVQALRGHVEHTFTENCFIYHNKRCLAVADRIALSAGNIMERSALSAGLASAFSSAEDLGIASAQI